ncbi:MAG: DUF4252 domain-containing protein [Bacteroidota bacterium]
MKKIVLILLTCSGIAVVEGQTVINKYMEKYEDDETFTKVSVNSKMFSLFAEMEGSEEDEQLFYDITSKLKGMKVIASEKVPSPKILYNGAVSDIEKAGFEELMTVKDAEENVKISIKDKNGIIEELIMVMGGKEKFALVSIFGEINLKQISKLASLMRINQLKYLENLDGAVD